MRISYDILQLIHERFTAVSQQLWDSVNEKKSLDIRATISRQSQDYPKTTNNCGGGGGGRGG